MNNLYEALEICLQDIEQGADLETVLFRYPELTEELRPILETAANARSMTIPAPSAETVRRNRAKVLQHAAELREAKARPTARRFLFASLRRVAVTLIVVTALFVSGTGLVRAASTTLPGDHLYPVKRTWEDVVVLFTFNLQQRDALEVEHENERLSEVQDLFAEGRSAKVDFSGLVTSQNGAEWLVESIPVVVSAQTEIRNQGIVVGSAVRIKGQTQANGAVLAERIELLPSGAILPDASENEIEQEHQDGSQQQFEDNSGKGSGEDSSSIEVTRTPEAESQPKGEFENSGSGSGNDSGSTTDGSNSGSSNDGGSHDSGGSHSGSDGSGDSSGGGDH